MNPALFLWLFLKASLFSTGGSGNLPSLHADLIPRGWATDQQFAESLTVGQVAPGPTGLWVISLGYFVDGVRGALLAFVAITIPPLLVLAVDRIYRRMSHHPVIEGSVRGLGLAVVGISFVVLAILLRSAAHGFETPIVAIAALALAATRRVPVFGILVLGALVGVVIG